MKATKDRIIEVAINNIKNVGQISSLTMASLAQEANIGKSTIYEYFKNKAEVMQEAVKEIVDSYTSSFLELEVTTFKDSFVRHAMYLLNAVEECRNFAMIVNREIRSIKVVSKEVVKIVMKSQEVYTTRIMEIFHLGFSENILKSIITSDDYLIMGLINGIFGLFGSKQIVVSKEEIIENLYQTIVKIKG
ncbi:MAG: TetR/AcrR family transcriptional regulator [Bacilli bacterium]|jgi:AcrR family transcriptional regulator|nr:TetR/AcrR family transcriptional regulator [Bacilli bacterium]MDD4057124.1 TetR/AcrR family transcriptional regulator [Bacilli bacterium]